jgi:hypothetical protein
VPDFESVNFGTKSARRDKAQLLWLIAEYGGAIEQDPYYPNAQWGLRVDNPDKSFWEAKLAHDGMLVRAGVLVKADRGLSIQKLSHIPYANRVGLVEHVWLLVNSSGRGVSAPVVKNDILIVDGVAKTYLRLKEALERSFMVHSV